MTPPPRRGKVPVAMDDQPATPDIFRSYPLPPSEPGAYLEWDWKVQWCHHHEGSWEEAEKAWKMRNDPSVALDKAQVIRNALNPYYDFAATHTPAPPPLQPMIEVRPGVWVDLSQVGMVWISGDAFHCTLPCGQTSVTISAAIRALCAARGITLPADFRPADEANS